MRSVALRLVLATFAAGAVAQAQEPAPTPEATPAPRARYAVRYDDGDQPVIGIETGMGRSKRDTLGLLVTGVTPDGPADKAGIVEGDRIASVNGVSLKLNPADAGEPDMSGLMTRRLVRELGKGKPGDEVTLSVRSNGSMKTVKLKTVARDDLGGTRMRSSDRAAIGISFGGGSVRDTLGLFVTNVTPGGPAEKAGIVEGDRVAAINGVDVRVPAGETDDGMLVWAKQERLTRVLRGVKAGDVVELKVYSNGSTRTVKVTTAKASDVFGESERDMRRFAGDMATMGREMSRMAMAPMAPLPPIPPMPPMSGHWRMDMDRDGDMDGGTVTCTSTGEGRVRCSTSDDGRAIRTVRAGRGSSFSWSNVGMGYGMGGGGDFRFPGLRLTSVTKELASYFGVGSESGLLVLEATSRWDPLNPGDVVLSHNGRAVVRDGESYLSINSDEDNTFVVLRKGKKTTITVKAK